MHGNALQDTVVQFSTVIKTLLCVHSVQFSVVSDYGTVLSSVNIAQCSVLV